MSQTPHKPALQEGVLRLVGAFITRCLYSVTSAGQENLPSGGVLLLPNHVTWVDALVLQIACPRPVRFVVFDEIYKNPWLNPIFRLVQAIPISPTRAREGMKEAVERLEAGEVVCIFPEGELSRRGVLLKIKKGFQIIAKRADCPVVPVWLDRLWGSIFSFEGSKFFFKWPKCWPYPVMVKFGEPIPAEKADESLVRERLQKLGEECYQARPMLKEHLGRASVRGLKRHQFKDILIDGTDGSSMSGGRLLAAGIAFAQLIKKQCPKKRVAVILPPGKAAILANLAIMLAGKIPVNLNFTAGKEAIESAIRRGDLEVGISAKLAKKKLSEFPWPPQMLYLEDIVPKLKNSAILWRILMVVMPPWMISGILGLPSIGDHNEAVLLFTSGSSGEPKGVVLSHRNIVSNVHQFSEMLNLRDPKDAILASLPIFHSFGCTVTLWFPMIEGIRVVTYTNPLEVSKNAELVHKYGITLMVATPTFLRAYIRKVEKEQMQSLKLIVTGAEKLPRDLAAAFYDKFGKVVLEGYGLTETSPVVSFNLPDPLPSRPGDSVQPSYRPGSVGRLAPGMAIKITNPDTGEHIGMHETGMLWLRGPNIFEGYLNDEKRTAEVLQEGWFKSGDLGRVDDEGFLYIEGRLSRFSKIAGEMVPHETVENKIITALGLPGDERNLAIVGVPDEAKGEALILVTTLDISAQDLRAKLSEAGDIPNLWIPRVVKKVAEIPVLGTGKLDLKGIKELALKDS